MWDLRRFKTTTSLRSRLTITTAEISSADGISSLIFDSHQLYLRRISCKTVQRATMCACRRFRLMTPLHSRQRCCSQLGSAGTRKLEDRYRVHHLAFLLPVWPLRPLQYPNCG